MGVLLLVMFASFDAPQNAFERRTAAVRGAMLQFRLNDYSDVRIQTSGDWAERQYQPPATIGWLAMGAALFATVALLAANAPPELRSLLDGRLWIGPASLPRGGLGAGLGARW